MEVGMKKSKVFLFVLLASLIFLPSEAYAREVPASKTSQSMTLDGKAVDANAYLIEDNNYFKLRDIAALLRDTEAKFNVSYDEEVNSVVIENNKTYEVLDTDLVPITVQKATATTSLQKIILDGGASSALYFNGKILTNPGRKMSTLLLIYEN